MLIEVYVKSIGEILRTDMIRRMEMMQTLGVISIEYRSSGTAYLSLLVKDIKLW